MLEVKVITAESEISFQEKFARAIEEVEAMGKRVDVRFRTNAKPIRPNDSGGANIYYTAFITFERSEPVQMDSIK